MDKSKYLAELTKLLGFMSSWDRQSVLRKYEMMFDAQPNTEALIEALGTPTRLAVELARDYVPSPPPAAAAQPEAPAEPSVEPAPAANAAEPAQPAEAPAAAAEHVPEPEPPAPAPQRRRIRVGGVFLSVLFVLIVGIPLALIALCIGLPFLSGGIAVIFAAVNYVLGVLPNLTLVSDILLMLGGGCAVSALGLLLSCFGLWLSVMLTWLWLSRAVQGLWKLLAYGKEAVKA